MITYDVCLSPEYALAESSEPHGFDPNLPLAAVRNDRIITAKSARHNLVAEAYACARDTDISSARSPDRFSAYR